MKSNCRKILLKLRFEPSWSSRPNPEDLINKNHGLKNGGRTKHTKKHKTKKMNSTVLNQIYRTPHPNTGMHLDSRVSIHVTDGLVLNRATSILKSVLQLNPTTAIPCNDIIACLFSNLYLNTLFNILK